MAFCFNSFWQQHPLARKQGSADGQPWSTINKWGTLPCTSQFMEDKCGVFSTSFSPTPSMMHGAVWLFRVAHGNRVADEQHEMVNTMIVECSTSLYKPLQVYTWVNTWVPSPSPASTPKIRPYLTWISTVSTIWWPDHVRKHGPRQMLQHGEVCGHFHDDYLKQESKMQTGFVDPATSSSFGWPTV